MEIWKSCVGYESFYEVSNFGNVRSLKRPVKTSLGIALKGGINLKKIIASTGYEVVNLTTGAKKRKQEHVHRLVLRAFCGDPPPKMEACHSDGVRTNNVLTNLDGILEKQIIKIKENMAHIKKGQKQTILN